MRRAAVTARMIWRPLRARWGYSNNLALAGVAWTMKSSSVRMWCRPGKLRIVLGMQRRDLQLWRRAERIRTSDLLTPSFTRAVMASALASRQWS